MLFNKQQDYEKQKSSLSLGKKLIAECQCGFSVGGLNPETLNKNFFNSKKHKHCLNKQITKQYTDTIQYEAYIEYFVKKEFCEIYERNMYRNCMSEAEKTSKRFSEQKTLHTDNQLYYVGDKQFEGNPNAKLYSLEENKHNQKDEEIKSIVKQNDLSNIFYVEFECFKNHPPITGFMKLHNSKKYLKEFNSFLTCVKSKKPKIKKGEIQTEEIDNRVAFGIRLAKRTSKKTLMKSGKFKTKSPRYKEKYHPGND